MTITQPSDTRKDEICTMVRADMYSAATRDRLVRLQYRAPKKFDFIIKIIYNKYIISKEKRYAGLAQLERASPLQGEGRRFDPVILYQREYVTIQAKHIDYPMVV